MEKEIRSQGSWSRAVVGKGKNKIFPKVQNWQRHNKFWQFEG
jgi:hypothetical protein